jgi:tRNA uridine 5-carboxymethylaminomethyl modification enzyme
MFTSRAEFRLTLRSDNADQRLTLFGAELGLASTARLEKLTEKMAAMKQLSETLHATRLPIGPSGTTAYDFLRRPDITWQDVRSQLQALPTQHPTLSTQYSIWAQVEIEAKYAGYIEREKEAAHRMHELEDKTIPANFHFAGIPELRKEARQALEKFRPQTIGQASRLEGITPGDLTVLMIYLRGKRKVV